jgi:hypothetical protein
MWNQKNPVSLIFSLPFPRKMFAVCVVERKKENVSALTNAVLRAISYSWNCNKSQENPIIALSHYYLHHTMFFF